MPLVWEGAGLTASFGPLEEQAHPAQCPCACARRGRTGGLEAVQVVNSAPRHARGISGFTLVEIMAAVLLLSIGLLAVLTASRAARETQRRALNISIGRNVAQSRIERLRSLPIESLAAQAGTTTDASLPPGNSVQTAVVGYPTAPEPHMRRVTVSVAWPEQNGTRTVRYETLIVRK